MATEETLTELPPMTPHSGRPQSSRSRMTSHPSPTSTNPWNYDSPALRQLSGVSRKYYPVGFWQHRRESLPDIDGGRGSPDVTGNQTRRPSIGRSYTQIAASRVTDEALPPISQPSTPRNNTPTFPGCSTDKPKEGRVRFPSTGSNSSQEETQDQTIYRQKLPPIKTEQTPVQNGSIEHQAHTSNSSSPDESETDKDDDAGEEANAEDSVFQDDQAGQPDEDAYCDMEEEGEETEVHETPKEETLVAPPMSEEDVQLQEVMRKVLYGDYTELPPAESSTVRVFLSSTFSDMKEERNRLACVAFPQLREYCSERGLDFQVMDMRWGVTDDVTNDHSTNTLCTQQIELCKRISIGPNFVAIVGNRYGFRPFPATVPEEEFDMLRRLALDEEIPNVDLLDSWFCKDDNAIPPLYTLMPINSRIKFFADCDPANEEQRLAARDLWSQTYSLIQTLLQDTVAIAVSQGKMTQARADQYFTSVTENEVNHGLLKHPNPVGICYFRHLEGLTDDLNQKAVERYIDLSIQNGETIINAEALVCLNRLKEDKIPAAVAENRQRQFKVAWQEGGLLDADYDDKERYMDELCQAFVEDIKILIDQGRKAKKELKKNNFYRDVLHHAHFCNTKVSTFCGREDLLSATKAYLQNAELSSQPLVLYGESGIGKTSVMAMIANQAKQWLGKNCQVVLRFLGTSPLTSDISSTLLSIAEQVCRIYDLKLPDADDLDSALKMNGYFQQLLGYVSLEHAAEKPLLLVLDSLDQLSADDGAHGVRWMPNQLPQNVYMIVSTLPKEHGILNNLKHRLPSEQDQCFLEVQQLPEDTGEQILCHHLDKMGRTLTYGQRQLLLSAFSRCPQALYLKILIDKALEWKSYTIVTEDEFTPTARDVIMGLFSRLETKYGQELVSATMSYITVSKGGITEVELEDALSCNNEVLDEVYQYHKPPIEGVVRIPSLLWARIRHDINEYLVEKQADGKTVVYWYHRQFIQAAAMRYLLHRRPEDSLPRYSRDLADIMCATGGIRKSITFTRLGVTMEHADRQIAPQPLSITNLRKLRKLPLYLSNSGSSDKDRDHLKEQCLCNFNFLLTKLKATSVHEVLEDFRRVRFPGDEVELVQDFFLLSAADLKKKPDSLAIEIIARIPRHCYKWPYVQEMVDEALVWISNQTHPLLLPKYPCKPSPGGLLKSTFQGYSHVLGLYGRGKGVMWGKEKGVEVWNFHTNEHLHHMNVTGSPENMLLSDNTAFVFHMEGTNLVQSEIETGSKTCEIAVMPDISEESEPKEGYQEPLFTIMAVSAELHWVAVRVNSMLHAPDGKRLLLVDLENKSVAQQIMECSDRVTLSGAAFTPDEKYLVVTTSSTPSSISVWNCKEHYLVGEIFLEKSMVTVPGKIRVSFDGEYATVACRLDWLVVLHVSTCQPYHIPEPPKKETIFTRIVDLHFLPNENIIWLSYNAKDKESFIKLWDFETRVDTFKGACDGMAASLTLSGDSALAFVCNVEGTVDIWNTEHMAKIHSLHAHPRQITNCVFVEFSKTLFTSSTDDTVKMWKLAPLLKDAEVSFNKPSKKKKEKKNQQGRSVRFGGEDVTQESDKIVKFQDGAQEVETYSQCEELETNTGSSGVNQTESKDNEQEDIVSGPETGNGGAKEEQTDQQSTGMSHDGELPPHDTTNQEVHPEQNVEGSNNGQPENITSQEEERKNEVSAVHNEEIGENDQNDTINQGVQSQVDNGYSSGDQNEVVDIEHKQELSQSAEADTGASSAGQTDKMDNGNEEQTEKVGNTDDVMEIVNKNDKELESDIESNQDMTSTYSNDSQTHKNTALVDLLRYNINQMIVTPDGGHVITCYESRVPVMWHIATAQFVRQLEQPEDTEGVPYILVCAPHILFGQAKIAGREENGGGKYKLVKWNLESGNCISKDFHLLCDLMCMTNDNLHLATYLRKEEDAEVVILNPDSLEAVRTLQLPRSHPSERMLVSCDLQNLILVQPRDNVVVYQPGPEKRVLESTDCITLRFRLRPESVLLYGDDLVMGNNSGFLFRCGLSELAQRIEEVTWGKVRLIEAGNKHAASVQDIVVEKEEPSRMVATMSADGSLLVVDMYRKDLMVQLKGHRDWVSCAVFSPGSHLVVSGSRDRTVRVWNLVDGQPIASLDVGDDVFSVDLSADGKSVVALTHKYGARRMVIMDLANAPDMKQL